VEFDERDLSRATSALLRTKPRSLGRENRRKRRRTGGRKKRVREVTPRKDSQCRCALREPKNNLRLTLMQSGGKWEPEIGGGGGKFRPANVRQKSTTSKLKPYEIRTGSICA